MMYKTVKTSMGHKFRVQMKPEEVRERRLMNITLVVAPFFGAMALFGIWLGVGG
jgi:hypothetical protein